MDTSPRFYFSSANFHSIISLLLLVSLIGLFIPLMEVDATQYASMSLEMLQNNSWLKVTDLSENYLDKPPLLFWLSTFSISLFGNTTWAYKLPSFIIAWSSVYFAYQLSKLYYTIIIARLSAILYAGSVAFILFTNDIRTDTLMISFVVLSVWQLCAYLENKKFKHFILASIALGLAMLSKGPIGLMVPLLAFIPHLVLKGKFKAFLNFKTLLLPIIILLVLSPMVLGLYQQWGMHGVRFFFWEQSFGRITGENVWKNEASPFYFLHNIAWAFIPFILFLILGLFHFLKNFFRQKEYISLFGLILPFIALSMSQFKLPHYIYVVVPFAAILTAKYLVYWLEHKNPTLDIVSSGIQSIIVLALSILPLALFQAFPASKILYFVYGFCFISILYISYRGRNFKKYIFQASLLFFILACFFLNYHAYPKLLKYQASSEAAFYLQKENLPLGSLYQVNIYKRAFHYYSGGVVKDFKSKNISPTKDVYIYTDQVGYESLQKDNDIELLITFNDFSITRLSLLFLNPKTRPNTLKTTYLLKIQN